MSIILITGTTSGIGLAMAEKLSAQGHHLILGCRNMSKGLKVKTALEDLKKGVQIDLLEVDLADLVSVQHFCRQVLDKYNSIDVLVNNAGLFSDTKKTTKDGFELTIGTNFIGHVLLTEKLLPLITSSDNSRIVNISSEAALFGRVKTDASFFVKPRKGFRAYAKSKLAQLLYTLDLAERLESKNVQVNAVHPGHVATNIWQGETLLMKIIGPINQKKYLMPDEAAKICVEVAIGDTYSKASGNLIEDKGIMKLNKRCMDKKLRKDLMTITREAIKGYL